MNKKIIVYALAGSLLAGGQIYASEGQSSVKEPVPVLISMPTNQNKVIKAQPVFMMASEQMLDITINNQKLALPEDTQSAYSNEDGIVMIPLRAVVEALGYQVTWNGEQQLVEIMKGPQWTTVTIGKDAYFFGRRAHESLGQAPVLLGNRTYVPVEFLTKILMQEVVIEDQVISINNEEKADIVYTFDQDLQGFKGGFADLPIDADPSIYELAYTYENIPVKGEESKGIYLTGHNRSDDLFMYIYKNIGEDKELKPSTRYEVNLSFEMATKIPGGMMGIGGSPGESVFVKAGVVGQEPANIEQDTYYRFNLDKGNQSRSGKDMQVIGNIVKPGTSSDDSYVYKKMGTTVLVETDKEGNAYLVIGLDSGFEGKTEVYFDQIAVSYKEVN